MLMARLSTGKPRKIVRFENKMCVVRGVGIPYTRIR